MKDLRYPIGKYQYQTGDFTKHKDNWLRTIAYLPKQLQTLTESMTEAQLSSPYRPGGWTAKEVIHHIADSHLNSIIRFKWALTEDEPLIKAYHEDRWATLVDYQETPIAVSLNLLDALHQRWVILMNNMTEEDWAKKFNHPEWESPLNLKFMLGLYDWHSRHHLAHVQICANK